MRVQSGMLQDPGTESDSAAVNVPLLAEHTASCKDLHANHKVPDSAG